MSEDRRITMRLTRIENTLEEIKRNITAPGASRQKDNRA